jgi:hypothetical protein
MDVSKRSHDKEIRFLHLKNENRNSFGHLYQNFFAHSRAADRKTQGLNKKTLLDGANSKDKTLDHKRRSLADLKSHFKIAKNEVSGGLGKSLKTRAKYDSLNSRSHISLMLRLPYAGQSVGHRTPG